MRVSRLHTCPEQLRKIRRVGECFHQKSRSVTCLTFIGNSPNGPLTAKREHPALFGFKRGVVAAIAATSLLTAVSAANADVICDAWGNCIYYPPVVYTIYGC